MPKPMQKENTQVLNLSNQHDISENSFLEHLLETDSGVILTELGISKPTFFRIMSQKTQLQSHSDEVNDSAIKAHYNVVDNINNSKSIKNKTNKSICHLYDKAGIGPAKDLVCKVPAD